MRKKSQPRSRGGFTLIELLVTIAVMAILVAISLFAIVGSKQSARDSRRKGDLETVRSGLELYRADCGAYPTPLVGGTLGSPVSATCAGSTNTYIPAVAGDPLGSPRIYRYARPTTVTYEFCASLEQGTGSQTCGGSSDCRSSGPAVTCNYKVIQP